MRSAKTWMGIFPFNYIMPSCRTRMVYCRLDQAEFSGFLNGPGKLLRLLCGNLVTPSKEFP